MPRWNPEERPRELLLSRGPEAASDASLLAIILRTGKRGLNAEELAGRILSRYGSLRALDGVSVAELCRIEGIGKAKAAQLKAAFELGKRLQREDAAKVNKSIRMAQDAVDYVAERLGPYLRDARKEFFYIILLDVKNKPLREIEIGKGSVQASIVDPKEIIREASLHSASGVILIHNHPSGVTEPSGEDVRITRAICQSCELVGVRVLDHIIVGKNREDYFSFSRSGLLP
ncbi:MAG: DNA repair protein RadC [Syntrophales bacterium]|nr:DNA repair protein RadC [Syntrophales bacterium]